jgi:hypothetical protein
VQLREQMEAQIAQLELQRDILHSTLDGEMDAADGIPASAEEAEYAGDGAEAGTEVEAERLRAQRAYDDDDAYEQARRDDESSEEEREGWGRRL